MNRNGIAKARETGAALVTVLLIAALLGVACIAMLTATSANSKNTTDVLSENKAYYAAETGIQATLNVLRGNTGSTVSYTTAINPATSNYSGDPSTTAGVARLSNFLTYNYTNASGVLDRVVIGDPSTYSPNNGTAYSVSLLDPDGGGLVYTTSITYIDTANSTIDPVNPNQLNVCSAGKKKCNGQGQGGKSTILFTPQPSTTLTGNATSIQLGSFAFSTSGSSSDPISSQITFEINYHMTFPRDAYLVMTGYINPQTNSSDPLNVYFIPESYTLLGATMTLQNDTFATPNPQTSAFLVLPNSNSQRPFYSTVGQRAPYRLLVTSIGYGPNGALKKLESVIRVNLFDGFSPPATTVMLGPNTRQYNPGGLSFLYDPGTASGTHYSGGNGCSTGGTCMPTFGVTDQTNYNYILANTPSGFTTSPPTLLDPTSLPAWLASPAGMEVLINQFRTVAQHANRYFVTPGSNISNPGTYGDPTTGAGKGITFCEGSCTVSGSGGGVLICTGKLNSVGGFQFNGVIIVTGEGGWQRAGGGGGQIYGNVIIAPYNKSPYYPVNLWTGSDFLPPEYQVTGAGGSTITANDINTSVDYTSGVNTFVVGIAEK